MNFFINDAYAAGGGTQGDPWLGLLPIIVIFVIFWFLLIRPQTKRAKQHREMVAALQIGDEIVTQGGILGRIITLDDGFVTVEIADGVKIRLQRNMVGSVMPKGTIENLD